MKKNPRFAIVNIGNDESYGLLFVAGELVKNGHQIQWFDGSCDNVARKIAIWGPDFVLFSPLAASFKQSLQLSNEIKILCKGVRCIFGGCHVSMAPECLELDGVDVVVTGPVYGTLDRIINSKGKELICGVPIAPSKMFPSRRECYEAIPRVACRHTKMLMSHFGCMYSCSYCNAPAVRKLYDLTVYKDCWMQRRPVEHLIQESKLFLEYPTKEVVLTDDDALIGSDAQQWLKEFARLWKKEINLPMYTNVMPSTVLTASDKTLKILAGLVNSVNMGVQAARKDSLKLFNRTFQGEKQIKAAYDRLQDFGIRARLEFIVGLPVDDPVGDAMETIKLVQRVGPGTHALCFPLMLFVGTALYDWCIKHNIPFNEECNMEFYTGIGSIKFDNETNRKIRNITKLAALFVKYNIDEHWMEALINMEMTEASSKKLSECKYYDSILHRLGKNGVADFDEILSGIHLKY